MKKLEVNIRAENDEEIREFHIEGTKAYIEKAIYELEATYSHLTIKYL